MVESAEKRTVRELLEKNYAFVRGLNITKQGGQMVAVTYAAKEHKKDRHYTRHKAALRQVEGRVELLEVVNT